MKSTGLEVTNHIQKLESRNDYIRGFIYPLLAMLPYRYDGLVSRVSGGTPRVRLDVVRINVLQSSRRGKGVIYEVLHMRLIRSVTITRCPTLGVYKVFIQGRIFRRIHIFPADLFNFQHNPGTPRFIKTFTPPARMTEMTSVFEGKGTCPTCEPGTCRDGRRKIVTRIPRWASPLIHAELEKLLNEHLLRP